MGNDVQKLIERLFIEYDKHDKSGIYGYTQRKLAFNSNKIEGSRLTEDQTATLFETQALSSDDMIIRSKDVEETMGHFVMFNTMLKTYKQELSEDLIKKYHYELKSGVFEDRANGYPIGEYKNRKNIVSDIATSLPQNVSMDMKKLLTEYNAKDNKTIKDIVEFHAKFENIHPFQDGNGRVGRIIIYKECLKNNLFPLIVEDENKKDYYLYLNKAQKGNIEDLLKYFKEEQEVYFNEAKDFLYEYTNEVDVDYDTDSSSDKSSDDIEI